MPELSDDKADDYEVSMRCPKVSGKIFRTAAPPNQVKLRSRYVNLCLSKFQFDAIYQLRSPGFGSHSAHGTEDYNEAYVEDPYILIEENFATPHVIESDILIGKNMRYTALRYPERRREDLARGHLCEQQGLNVLPPN
jgi:hypothetical protein